MLPFLETDAFTCLWHDSTWQTLLQIPFDEFRGSYPLLYEWDQLVLQKSDLIVYAADWVYDETVRYYTVDPDMLTVIPFGASIFDPADGNDVAERSVTAREPYPCQLTFVGVDWIRKGLHLAHSLTKRLNLEGVPTVLNVIGVSCEGDRTSDGLPPRSCSFAQPFNSGDLFRLRLCTDADVRTFGFLNKDIGVEYEQFCGILRDTHFLVHPAEFECFGVVLAEANAFGVPVLSVDCFGPRSVIKPGLNGHLFKRERFVTEAATCVASRLKSYDLYHRECRAAYAEYENRLNWRTNCQRLLKLIQQAIQP